MQGRISLSGWLSGLVILLLVSPELGAAQKGDLQPLREQHVALHTDFVQKLEALARECEQNGLLQQAKFVRQLEAPLDTRQLKVINLPDKLRPAISPDLPALERNWQVQLRYLQETYAKELYLLARRVLQGGYASYAYDLIHEVAHHDPDQPSARKLLGYVQHEDRWVTPFEASMLRKRYVWHEQFGWLPTTHVQRYERGERYFQGRWIPADREAAIRQDFSQAWEIQTGHFLIKTNHSLEQGVKIAAALEQYYRVFSHLFAGFFDSPEQIQQLFSGSVGSPRPRTGKPMEVHFYRTREEYIARLKTKFPQIEITNGMYDVDARTSFFYYDPERTDFSTIYHEASHQIFYESENRNRMIAEHAHFWIVEGIACYMESFQNNNGTYTLGDPNYIRFEAARYRLLNDRYYVRLQQFASMGLKEFQTSPEIRTNYSQASGMAHFFMHYDGGRYRDALIEHLSQIYKGNTRFRNNPVQTLDELTGTSYEELDKQYVLYSKELDESLRGQQP